MKVKVRDDGRVGFFRILLAAFAMVMAASPLYADWYEVGGGTGDVQVSILQGSWASTTFEVLVPGMEVTPETVDTEVFNHVSIPGARAAGLIEGRPELPRVNVTLAIPRNAGAVTVDVTEKDSVCFNIPDVYPQQPEGAPVLGEFYIDRDFYAKDTVYPGYDQTRSSPADWRDLRLLRIEVYPVQVNPARDTVVVMSRFQVTVNHPGTVMTEVVPAWLAPMCAGLVDNYDSLGIVPQPDDDEPGTRCLVFLRDTNFAHNVWFVDSLLGWMYKRGYQWDTVRLTSASPMSIKQRIKDEYASHSPPVLRWVLLVGDVADIPSPGFTKQKWLNSRDSVGACDHWYADFNHPNLDSCDDFAEVGLSRLSVVDTADLTRQAMKIVGYMKSPPSDSWLMSTTLVGHDQSADPPFPRIIRGVAQYIQNRCNYFWPTLDTILGNDTSVTNQTVSDGVNQGTGVLLYAGHGIADAWLQWTHDDQNWTTDNVRDLANGSRTPVVLTVACSTGYIVKDTCLAEEWMRKYPGGAVASLGSSIKSRGDASRAQCTTLVRALYDAQDCPVPGCSLPVFDVGGVLMYMDAYLATYFPDQGTLPHSRNIYSYLFLGDPTMQIWSGGVPEAANVAHPFWIPLEAQDVTVHVRLADNRPVDARVCLSKGNDVYATGLTNASGQVTLSINPSSVGWMDITVSEGHAHAVPHTPILPYEGRIAVGLSGWLEAADMPYPPSGRKIRAGGWLSADTTANVVYAAKGNNRGDFYRFAPDSGGWLPKQVIDSGPRGKFPRAGCRGAADGQGNVYMVKGNRTREFWRYDVAEDEWYQLADVLPGEFGGRVKTGSDLVYAQLGDTGFVYLLKGFSRDFMRFRIQGDSGTWELCNQLPSLYHVDKGDWLVFDGDNKVYAHQAKHRQLWTYNTSTGQWGNLPRPGIPLGPRNKKPGDGSCGAWYDGSIYALKGKGRQEFWRYDPVGDSWHELDDMPLPGIKRRVKDGADITAIPGYGLFATKGYNTNTFWLYRPASPGCMLAGSQGSGGPIPCGPALGGEEPLMDGLAASRPRWNRQGTMVCYSKQDTLTGHMAVYQRRYGLSMPEEQVTELDEDCETPVYSPNGMYIAFQLDDTTTGFYQLCVTPATGLGASCEQDGRDVAATGTYTDVVEAPASASVAPVAQSEAEAPTGAGVKLGSITQVTFDAEDHCYPEWSPDGMWLCYERDDTSGYTQIWRVPAFGGNEDQLTFANADHFSPKYLNSSEIVFMLSPDDGNDQLAKVNVYTHEVTILTCLPIDHGDPDPSWDGLSVISAAPDDSGNTQIVKVASSGGSETWLTSGSYDLTEPDYGQDNQTIFAVRWTGSTSQIVWVDGVNGGYTPVTDSLAIRDNPDAHVDTLLSTALAVYEREPWDLQNLLFGRGRRRPGAGVYLSRFRVPRRTDADGAQGASLGVLALERAKPNPASGRVTIHWQVPVEADVSLCVYNAAGQLVKTLANERCKPGSYTSVWNGTDAKGRRLANGVYFYALDNGMKRISRKVILTE